MNVDKVGQKEIQFSDWDVDMIRVDAQVGVETVRWLFEPLAIGALQRNRLEQDDLNKVQSPNLSNK